MSEKCLPKAYMISADYADCSEVVWAESSGKTKRIALDSCESMWDLRFIDLRAKRLPEVDLLYSGKAIADWYDMEIRIKLVSEYGWHCAEPDYRDCKVCPANSYCDTWEELQEDAEMEEEVSG